jgi:hypothetical protein
MNTGEANLKDSKREAKRRPRLRDSDMTSEHVYGRRTLLRGMITAALGTAASLAMKNNVAAADSKIKKIDTDTGENKDSKTVKVDNDGVK